MKKHQQIHLLVASGTLALATILSGCTTSSPCGTGAPLKDIPVIVANGNSLEQAVLTAAARRRWTPAKQADGSYRLTIDQRGNRCVVDVILSGNTSYSILPVESNITVAKYDQWVNNLQREITMRAQTAK